MKTKLFTLILAIVASAAISAAPSQIPSPANLSTAGYDTNNNIVLCCYFDDVPCNDVVFVGTYAMIDGTGAWITNPSQLNKFKSLQGFRGWYVVEVPFASGAEGKPVQLQNDGTFSWNYQSGDSDAWIYLGGEEANVRPGYNDEANISFPVAGAYIYEIAYWKQHNIPCSAVTHVYTINVYAPDACEEIRPAIIGDFQDNSWNTAISMIEKVDSDLRTYYSYTVEATEKAKFNFRDITATDLYSQFLLYYDNENNKWEWCEDFVLPDTIDNLTNVVVTYDFSDNSKYRWSQCDVNLISVTLSCDPTQGVVSGSGYYSQGTNVNISATPNYGYHFVQWSDGNTDNPRTIVLTQDTTLVAQFASDPLLEQQVWPILFLDSYTSAEWQQYIVSDFRPNEEDRHIYCWGGDNSTYDAGVQTGLNFFGNTDGYLSLIVGNQGWAGAGVHISNDASLLAIEVLRQAIIANPQDYYLHIGIKSTDNASHAFGIMRNSEYIVLGDHSVYDGTVYQDFERDGEWHEFYLPMTLFANALTSTNFQSGDYIFAVLSEGTQGVQLNLDAVYFCNKAFKDNVATSHVGPSYTILSEDNSRGVVQINEYIPSENKLTFTAISNYGYHFVQWSDGNTDNPRTIVLTQDTTLIAQFASDSSPSNTTVKIGNLWYDLDATNRTAEVAGGGSISVSDNSISDWEALPSRYVNIANCPYDARFGALKSLKVFADSRFINLLVEPDMDFLPNLEWVPFEIFIDADNSYSTGGYGDEFVDANSDILLEGALFSNYQPCNYTPVVYKWWGTVGGSGWEWYDSNINPSEANCYGAIVCEGQLQGCSSQFVNGKFEIQIERAHIPTQWNSSEFGIGCSILQYWATAGRLPQASQTGSNPYGIANKMKVRIGNHTSQDVLSINGNVTIPSSVTYEGVTYSVTAIGANAFNDCTGLTSLTINSETPPTLGINAFPDNIPIYVPCGALGAYQSAWPTYSNSIKYYPGPHTLHLTDAAEQGTIEVTEYSSICSNISVLTAIPNYGYHFVQWSDGNTDNPRTIELTQDTTFAAEFAVDKSGVCGDDNLLRWKYTDDGTLTISGEGTLNSNYTFGVEAPTGMKSLIVKEGVTSIGDNAFMEKQLASVDLPQSLVSIGKHAFADNNVLKKIIIPSNVTTIGIAAFQNSNRLLEIVFGEDVENIGDSAFYNCPYLLTVHAQMEYPPVINSSVFDGCGDLSGIDCYVQQNSLPLYKKTAVWKEFNLIVGAKLFSITALPSNTQLGSVTGTGAYAAGVEVTLTATPRTGYHFTCWNDGNTNNPRIITVAYDATYTALFAADAPTGGEVVSVSTTEEGATITTGKVDDNEVNSYSLAICQNGDTICVLTMDAEGRLTGIDFRSMPPRHLPQQTNVEAGGLNIPVTGLTPGTTYHYTLDALDRNKNILDRREGEFTTEGEAPEGFENIDAAPAPQKILRDGQVLILRGDKTYTVTGQEVK